MKNATTIKIFQIVAGLIIVVALGMSLAHAGDLSGNYYDRGDARRMQQVEAGEILAIRPVVLNTQSRGSEIAGTGVGAALGAVLGQSIGQGTGKQVASIAMATLGGIAGNRVSERMSEADGMEIIVRKENGQMTAITQEVDRDSLSMNKGDKVYLVSLNGSNARVVKAW